MLRGGRCDDDDWGDDRGRGAAATAGCGDWGGVRVGVVVGVFVVGGPGRSGGCGRGAAWSEDVRVDLGDPVQADVDVVVPDDPGDGGSAAGLGRRWLCCCDDRGFRHDRVTEAFGPPRRRFKSRADRRTSVSLGFLEVSVRCTAEEEGDTYNRNDEGPGRSVERLDRCATPGDEALASGFAAELTDRGDWVVGGGDDCEVGFVGHAVLWQVVV